jgi:hypothetical protein
MARKDQTPRSLLFGALFLRAVAALPYAIDQFPIQLVWKISYRDSWGMQTIQIGHEEIILDTTEAFDSGHGWDHETNVLWKVDEHSSTCIDESALESFLSYFVHQVTSDDCKVYFATEWDHGLEDFIEDLDVLPWSKAFDDEA